MKTQRFMGRMSSAGTEIPIWAASVSLNILSLVMPLSILLIFDRVIPFQSMETLRMLTLALLITAAAELLLRWCRSVLLTTTAEDAAVSNYRHFMTAVLHANSPAFAQDTSSVHFARYLAIGHLRDHCAGQNQTLAIDLPFAAVFALMIGLIGGWLILVPLAAFCGVMIFALCMKRVQWSLFNQRKVLDSRRYAFLSGLLANMTTVKSNRMEPQMTRRFEMLEDQTVEVSRQLIQFSGFAQSFGAVLSQFLVAAMGLFGAYLVILNHIGIAELAACMLLNGRIIQPLTKFVTLRVQSENVAASKAKLHETLSIRQNRIPACAPPQLIGTLEATDFALTRARNSDQMFSPVTFAADPMSGILIEADESWMVDALFDAITGQRDPDNGTLTMDGFAATERVFQRGHNGIVALESTPAVFSGTLLENLSAFGDDDMVQRAKDFAASLGLEKRIHRLPMGYHTQLNSGVGFEKDPVNRQLIALARALALQPRVLLMNEPTAILDTPERQALAQCLLALSPKPTLVLASPDPRMRKLVSRSVRLWSPDARDWRQDIHLNREATEPLRRGAA